MTSLLETQSFRQIRAFIFSCAISARISGKSTNICVSNNYEDCAHDVDVSRNLEESRVSLCAFDAAYRSRVSKWFVNAMLHVVTRSVTTCTGNDAHTCILRGNIDREFFILITARSRKDARRE